MILNKICLFYGKKNVLLINILRNKIISKLLFNFYKKRLLIILI